MSSVEGDMNGTYCRTCDSKPCDAKAHHDGFVGVGDLQLKILMRQNLNLGGTKCYTWRGAPARAGDVRQKNMRVNA